MEFGRASCIENLILRHIKGVKNVVARGTTRHGVSKSLKTNVDLSNEGDMLIEFNIGDGP